MQGVIELKRFYDFSKVMVFDKLRDALAAQKGIYLSFKSQMEEQIGSAGAQLELLCNQKEQWKGFGG